MLFSAYIAANIALSFCAYTTVKSFSPIHQFQSYMLTIALTLVLLLYYYCTLVSIE